MFNCNRHETRLINGGTLHGVIRRYANDVGCPHDPGGEIIFTSKFLRKHEGKEVPFAKGTVVSVRPGTVGEFRRSDVIAQMGGYANGVAWHTYFATQQYPGIRDDERVYNIQVRVTDVDKSL